MSNKIKYLIIAIIVILFLIGVYCASKADEVEIKQNKYGNVFEIEKMR